MYPIGVIINNIVNYIVWPAFFGLVTVMVIYAGILFVTSSGDPAKITKARQAVAWAAVGAFVGVASYIAVGFMRFLLGV